MVPTTVLEALVNAGGFRDFANQKKIVIIARRSSALSSTTTSDQGQASEQNILLEAGRP